VVYPPKTVTHPSTNRARRRVTSLISRTMLPLRGYADTVHGVSPGGGKELSHILSSLYKFDTGTIFHLTSAGSRGSMAGCRGNIFQSAPIRINTESVLIFRYSGKWPYVFHLLRVTVLKRSLLIVCRPCPSDRLPEENPLILLSRICIIEIVDAILPFASKIPISLRYPAL